MAATEDPVITGMRALPLKGATPDGGWSQGFDPDENLHTLVEVTTSVGVGGLGSVFTSLKLVEGAIQLLKKHLLGQSAREPMRVTEIMHQETFWQGRGGSVTHTISGIDIALWDIFGKLCRQPVCRLLGGRYRESIRPYGSLLMAEPEEMKARVLDARARGFKSFKIGWGPFGRVRCKALLSSLVLPTESCLSPSLSLRFHNNNRRAPRWTRPSWRRPGRRPARTAS
eukprot:SAG22_NODE_34_length_27479_cov_10.947480_9_plen_227_part_00